VQQDQRPPDTDRLEIEIDAVDVGVLSGAFGTSFPIGRGHDDAPLFLPFAALLIRLRAASEFIGYGDERFRNLLSLTTDCAPLT
jgi:hypothetical protein